MSLTIFVSLSDSLALQTGFGRVMRRLSQYFSRKFSSYVHIGFGKHYIGDIYQMTETRSEPEYVFGQDVLATLFRSYPDARVVLFTLMDAWNVDWIPYGDKSYFRNAWYWEARKKLKEFYWIGYFPVDAQTDSGGYPSYLVQVMAEAHVRIYMSEFGRSVSGFEAPVLPHGCDVQYRDVSKAACTNYLRRLTRGNFEVNYNDVVVLVVAANRRRKYWPVMLRAFRMLTDLVPAKLIGVYGGDGDWDLLQLCEQYNLRVLGRGEKPNVWLIRSVPEIVLNELYNACDVVWLISGGEGFGLPQLEAHGAGRPCIVGSYSASREYAVDACELVEPCGFYYEEPYGLLRPIYDPEHIVQATLKVISMSDIREKALKFAAQFTWDNVYGKLDQIFGGLLWLK